jgi:hypothetical protein
MMHDNETSVAELLLRAGASRLPPQVRCQAPLDLAIEAIATRKPFFTDHLKSFVTRTTDQHRFSQTDGDCHANTAPPVPEAPA